MTGYTLQTTKAKYSQIFDSTGAIRCCNMVSITGVFFEAKSDKKTSRRRVGGRSDRFMFEIKN